MTLRSAKDGHLLARVVERAGTAFVLDWGEPEVVADACHRVLHAGFAVAWQGRQETAVPGSPDLIRLLALHYAGRGYLVFVDEPDFPRKPWVEHAPPPDFLSMTGFESADPPTLLPDEPTAADFDTDLVPLEEVRRLMAARYGTQTPDDGG